MTRNNSLKRAALILALTGSFFLTSHPQELPRPPKKHAVIIRGRKSEGFDEEKYIKNTNTAYKAFLKLGFEDDNIYILTPYGDEEKDYPVYAKASHLTIERLFNRLSKEITEDNLFFLYMNDHGNMKEEYGKPIYKFSMGEERLSAGELEVYLSQINPGQGILLFGFCNSGGFSDRLGNGKFAAIASTMADKDSHTTDEDKSFDYHFIQGLTVKWADANRDYQISVGEAYRYALDTFTTTANGFQFPTYSSEKSLDEIFLE